MGYQWGMVVNGDGSDCQPFGLRKVNKICQMVSIRTGPNDNQ